MSDRVKGMGAAYLSHDVGSVVPEGYKQTEMGVIPEDWEARSLGGLVVIRSGESPSRFKFFSEGVPYYKVEQLNNGAVYADKTPYYVDVEKVIEAGSIIFPKRGASILSNKIRVLRNDSFMDTNLMTLTCLNDLHNLFLHFQLAYRGLNTVADTTSIPQINNKHIIPYLIPVPKKKEQTAIAKALSDVDALISEQEKLIAKKQAIKTATMQQLLTGRTRLPQFSMREDGAVKGYKKSELGEVPEDWEVAQLRNLLLDSPKYGINTAAVPLTGSLPVYIRITDISEDGYFKPSKKVGVNHTLSTYYLLSREDIVMARTGASVGKSYLYRPDDGELVYAGFLIKISPDQGKLKSDFLSQYLKTKKYWDWIEVNSMRSGQPGVNGNELGTMFVPCPTVEEQSEISEILADMDESVQVLKRSLRKTRQIKQGMMQELLTGKTRLVKPEQSQ